MLEFADNVLVPYVTLTKESLSLQVDAKAIAHFDVFTSHRSELFLKKLQEANIMVCFIPAGCTGLLQSWRSQLMILSNKRLIL